MGVLISNQPKKARYRRIAFRVTTIAVAAVVGRGSTNMPTKRPV